MLVLAGALAPTPAAGQRRSNTAIEQGREALRNGHYVRAIELLEGVVRRGDDAAEAHYLLAQAFLASDNPGAARKEIARARALDDASLKYAVAQIEILRASTPAESSISITDGRRIALATSILDQAPENPAALEDLGLHHAANYRWYANFDATKQPLGHGVARKAEEEFDAAVDFLRRAIDSDPNRLSAYGELLRLFVEEGQWSEAGDLALRATRAVPRNPDPWLFRGLTAQLQNHSEEAMPFFERALGLMSPGRRESFLDISLFLDQNEQASFRADPERYRMRYWAERDPFRLTDVNERLADHYARMAYSQLWYGDVEGPGWDTERGRIVVRYGIPWSDASFIGGYSRFNVIEYRDFEFVFEDITRGGHYTLYSPKASASSSWTNDYVIQAGEMAISNPEQYDPKLIDRVDLLVETSAFRGEAGRTDLYVHVLIPVSSERADEPVDGRVGAFVTDENDSVIDRGISVLKGARASGTPNGIQSTEAVHCSPGSYRIGVEYLSDDRSAAGRLELTADIPPFGGDSLSASDVLAAYTIDDAGADTSGSPNAIIRSGYLIRPMPWTLVEAGSDLLVYFEVYGLTLDSAGRGTYRVNARVEKAAPKSGLAGLLSRVFGGNERESVAASIQSTSQTADGPRVLSIALPKDLSQGDYRFALELTDLHTGRTVTRRHPVGIVHAEGH